MDNSGLAIIASVPEFIVALIVFTLLGVIATTIIHGVLLVAHKLKSKPPLVTLVAKETEIESTKGK